MGPHFFCASVPRVGHLHLLVELFGRGVQPAAAGRAADGRLGLDIASVTAADAGGQHAEIGLRRVFELCAAVFAADFVGCSHGRFLLGSRCKGTTSE